MNDPIDFIDPLGLSCYSSRDAGQGEPTVICVATGLGGSGGPTCTLDGDEMDCATALRAVGIHSAFDLIVIAHAQTGSRENPACPNGDCAPGVPKFIAVYGNSDLLGLLGLFGPSGQKSGFFDSARLPGETRGQCFERTQKALLGQGGANALHAVSGASLVLFAGSASVGTQLAPTGTSTPGPSTLFGTVHHTQTVPKPSFFEKVFTLRNPPPTGALRGFFAGVAKATGIVTAVSIGLELGFLAACR